MKQKRGFLCKVYAAASVILREEGLIRLLFIFCGLLTEPFFYYRRFLIVVHEGAGAKDRPRAEEAYQVRTVGSEDTELLLRFTPNRMHRLIREQFDSDSVCFIASAGDEPAGCGWISFRPAAYLRELSVEAYLCGDYVVSAFRGKGIHQLLVRVRTAYAKQRQLKNTAALVASHNLPARNSFQRAGFHEAGRISVVSLLGHRRVAVAKIKEAGKPLRQERA